MNVLLCLPAPRRRHDRFSARFVGEAVMVRVWIRDCYTVCSGVVTEISFVHTGFHSSPYRMVKVISSYGHRWVMSRDVRRCRPSDGWSYPGNTRRAIERNAA